MMMWIAIGVVGVFVLFLWVAYAEFFRENDRGSMRTGGENPPAPTDMRPDAPPAPPAPNWEIQRGGQRNRC